MLFAEEILEYFLEKHELQNGTFSHGPQYYHFNLNGEMTGTELVLARTDKGYIVSLVNKDQSVSVHILQASDNLKLQLDSFVRGFHTETAVHHRKLSNPTTGDKVKSNIRASLSSTSPPTTGAGFKNLPSGPRAPDTAPVFEDEHQLLSSRPQPPQMDIGARDLDPFGRHPEMRPALTGPFGGNQPNVGLPSQGGMHPTPFGSNIRYDPPGPGQGPRGQGPSPFI